MLSVAGPWKGAPASWFWKTFSGTVCPCLRAGSICARQQAHGRHAGRRLHQRLGVRVLRVLQQLACRPGLHHRAAVHHHQFGGAFGCQSQIVGNQQHGRAQFLGHRVDLVQDGALHRYIQCRRRLVCDQQPRPAGQANGDQGTLAHAAGEFMRVLLGTFLGVGQSRRLQHLHHFPVHVTPGRHPVHQQGLRHLRADLGDRVQVGHRILRDQADLAAADGPHPVLGQPHQLLAVEADAPGGHPAVARQQADQGHGRGRLPGTGLTDNRQRLALFQAQPGAFHCGDFPVRRAERNGQIRTSSSARRRHVRS